MITTDKTENDSKGGQIALVQNGPEVYVTLIEQAQAKQSGQLELFEKLGLEIKNNGQQAFFNTNIAIFNYEVLAPLLSKLLKDVGRDEFLQIVTPDLIENKKKQRDPDGVERVYEQLEGAMGSTLLNLDRHWRKRYNEPLVHFINIERPHRTLFFSPIKNAFDFFMLFYSDRYSLDETTFRLKDHRPGFLPSIDLQSEFYQEVNNVLESFQNTKILNLDKLQIKGGPAFLKGVELVGSVTIENSSSGIIDLSDSKKIENQDLKL